MADLYGRERSQDRFFTAHHRKISYIDRKLDRLIHGVTRANRRYCWKIGIKSRSVSASLHMGALFSLRQGNMRDVWRTTNSHRKGRSASASETLCHGRRRLVPGAVAQTHSSMRSGTVWPAYLLRRFTS